MIIGLTGGIGSGKTTVAQYFAELGVPIIDADIIARELVTPGSSALIEITKRFGTQILDTTGQLRRDALKKVIFHHDQERQWLEALLHPLIRQEIQRRLQTITSPYCIVVIPLLIEKGFQNLVHRILIIDTQEALQQARIQQRDKASTLEIDAIFRTQCTREQRLTAAHDIICNDKDLAWLKNEVLRLHAYYLTLTKKP